MTVTTQVVSVPLGSGIETGTHEWRTAPPSAKTLDNFDVRLTGSYTKRTGYEQKYALSGNEGSDILVSHRSGLAIINDHETRVFTGDSTSKAQDFGSAVPVNVTSHIVSPSRGVLSNANIARNGTEIAVIVIETGVEGIEREQAVMFILDSSFQIIWGPYRDEDIRFLPRVEPLGTGFLFMGRPGLSSGINAVFGSASVGAPGSSFVLRTAGVGLFGPCNNSEEAVVWDSYAVNGATQVFIVSTAGSAGYFHFLTSSIDTSFVVKTETPATGLAGTTKYNVSIWHDSSANAVLIAEDNTNKVWYHSDTYEDGATGGWTQASASSEVEAYCFYESDNTVLNLNSQVVTISTGPLLVTVTTPAHADYGLVYHRRPQPSEGGGAYFFRRYTEVTERDAHNPFRGEEAGSDRMVKGGEELCFKESAKRYWDGGNIEALKEVCKLQRGRKDLWYYDHYHTTWDGATGSRTYKSRGTIGQSCKRDNKIFIPHIIVNKNYTQPPYWTDEYRTIDEIIHEVHADPGTATPVTGVAVAPYPQANFSLHARDGGAGLNEGVTQLIISEIELNTPSYTSLPMFGSTLVAAGGLSIFDGTLNLPAYLDVPTVIDLDENAVGSVIQTDESTYIMYILPDGYAVKMKGVLFAIDASGIKYRSKPFDLGIIENDSGADEYYHPLWTLTVPSCNNGNFLWTSRRLSVEIYVTAGYQHASEKPTETYTLVDRGPVFWHSPHWHIQAWFKQHGAGGDTGGGGFPYEPEWGLYLNPTSGYWEAELEAQPPPCTNVIAHAGKYIFAVRSEDPHTIAVSKPLVAFLGPEFNSLLEITAPVSSGGVVSLAASGDRLILLCENGTWDLFVGVGPDANGVGSFPDFRQIRLGDGCVSHKTTVVTPAGVFYVAKSGPKLVAASGELVDIGRSVRSSFLTSGINSVVYDAVREEILVFRDSSSDIYDVSTGAWTHSTIGASAAVLQNDVLWRVDGGGDNLRKKDSSPADGSSGSIIAKYVSPWVKLSSPMDLVRVQRVGVLIEKTAGTGGQLIIKLAYDYTDTDIDTFTFPFSTFSILDKKIQLRVKPTRQKCDSIRITVTEATEGSGQQEINDLLWSLVAIDLEAATKQGIIKLESGATK